MITRRQIIRSCKSRGWVMEPTVLEAIQQHLQQTKKQQQQEVLQDLWTGLKEYMQDENMITLDLWESFINNSVMEASSPHEEKTLIRGRTKNSSKPSKSIGTSTTTKHSISTSSNSSSRSPLDIMNAFDTPRLVYNTLRKQFHVEEKRWSLFGSAQDKITMTSQRYALIHQRMLRHELLKPEHHTSRHRPHDLLFSQSQSQLSQSPRRSTKHRGSGGANVLTPIETLLGKENIANVPFLLLGILLQIEEGQYYLEDPTGQLPISFHYYHADAANFFVLEQSILLVEATFQDGMLYIQRMAQPFVEPRRTTQQLLEKQIRHSYWNRHNRIRQGSNDDSSFVILSDIHLDQPKTFQMLEGLFESYEHSTAMMLPMFVFMGNFLSSSHSTNTTKTQLLQQCLDDFATLLQQKFPNIAQHGRIVLVPGPNDHDSLIYPQQPLLINKTKQQRYQQQVPNLEFATNPCRIRHTTKEMVIFRSDVLNHMQMHQLQFSRQQDEDDIMMTDENPLHCQWIKTILDQGHLCPMSHTIPIYWNYDHSMRLYPLPDTLVLGGSSNIIPNEFHENYYDVDVIHPGSWSKNHSYATYQYNHKEEPIMEDSDEDEDDNGFYPNDMSSSQVDFHQVVQNK